MISKKTYCQNDNCKNYNLDINKIKIKDICECKKYVKKKYYNLKCKQCSKEYKNEYKKNLNYYENFCEICANRIRKNYNIVNLN